MTSRSSAAAPTRASAPRIQLRPTAEVALAAAPIERSWLIDAPAPRSEAALLAADEHDTLAVYLWQTTRARYRWEHESAEVVTVLDGECFVSEEGRAGSERHLGTGDVAFFPAGSRSQWRVPERLRKVSTLVRPLPRPAVRLLHAARLVKRTIAGLRPRRGAARRLPDAEAR